MKRNDIQNILAVCSLIGLFALFCGFLFGGATFESVIVTGVMALICVSVAGLINSVRSGRVVRYCASVVLCIATVVATSVYVQAAVAATNLDQFTGTKEFGLALTASNSDDNKAEGEVTVDGWKISIEAIGYDDCGTIKINTVKVTISSPAGNPKVTFNLTCTNGAVSGIEQNSDGKYELDAGGSFTFQVESEEDETTTVTGSLEFSNVEYVADGTPQATTFKLAEGGSYTVTSTTNGTTQITVDTPLTQPNDEAYTLTATAANGYVFYGWMSELRGKLSSNEYKVVPGKADTVYPLFIKSDSAVYYVQNTNPRLYYGYFDDAFTAAGSTGTVVVEQSGTVYGSTNQTSLTIGDTQKLLIPFSASDTGIFGAYPTDTVYSSTATPSTFRTLTVPSGTSIVCSGEINVNGQRRVSGQGAAGTGAPKGKHGKLVLNGSDNQLVIADSGALYCYGFVTGTGSVEIQSGGVLRELMQIYDWAGGSNVSNWYTGTGGSLTGHNDKPAEKIRTLFFTSRYFIQNIEVPLIMKAGSELYAEAVLTASGSQVTSSAKIIGNESALFILGSGTYVTRTYSAETDRVEYCGNGSGSIDLGEITISASGRNLTSSAYTLPINNAMTVRVGDGVEVNLSNRFAILPGAKVIVEQGGTINLSNHLYIFDIADWTDAMSFGNQKAPLYTVGRGSTVKLNITDSGLLEVNGELNITGNGGIYTTTGNTSSDEVVSNIDKVVKGTGTINHNGTLGEGALRTGYSGTLYTITPSDGLANLAGLGEMQAFSTGTYYGLGPDKDNYWYQHLITVEGGVEGVTTNTDNPGPGESPYKTVKRNGKDVNNVVGYSVTGGEYVFNVADGKVFVCNTTGTTGYSGTGNELTSIDDDRTLSLAVAGIMTDTPAYYTTLAGAVAAYGSDSYIKMVAPTTEPSITATDKTIYLDLNGKTVTLGDGTGILTVTKLYGMDSATNDYTGTPGKINGTVSSVADYTQYSPSEDIKGKYYVAHQDTTNNTWSFHRFDLGVDSYTFYGSENTGAMEFTAVFMGDQTALGKMVQKGFYLIDSTGKSGANWADSGLESITKDGVTTGYKLTGTLTFNTTTTVGEQEVKGPGFTDEFTLNAALTLAQDGEVFLGPVYFPDGISFKSAMEAVYNNQDEDMQSKYDNFAENNGFNPLVPVTTTE